ncbi:MAG: hypothetical protein IJV34_07530 [Prevotella sp.]|nr:hypothetical protein [Prevotella sp.]
MTKYAGAIVGQNYNGESTISGNTYPSTQSITLKSMTLTGSAERTVGFDPIIKTIVISDLDAPVAEKDLDKSVTVNGYYETLANSEIAGATCAMNSPMTTYTPTYTPAHTTAEAGTVYTVSIRVAANSGFSLAETPTVWFKIGGTYYAGTYDGSGTDKYCTFTFPATVVIGEVAIGDDATNSSYVTAYFNFCKYSTYQMIYTPAEVGQAGDIRSIAFKVATASSYTTTSVKIYLAHKNKAWFTSPTDYFPASDLTLVYSGSLPH